MDLDGQRKKFHALNLAVSGSALLFLSAFMVCFWPARAAWARQGTLTLLFTNDHLGQIDPLENVDLSKPVGGVTRRMALIEKIRKEVGAKNVLVVDGGDILSGTAFSELTRGEVDCAAYHLMGYDAVALGEHDLDYGKKAILEYESRKGFDIPFVSVNVVMPGNHQNFVRPYVMRYAGGINVGIIGFSNPDTPAMTRRDNVRGLSFQPAGATAKGIHSILRKNVDLFIALSRLGVEEDKKFAKDNPFLHVIIGGHSQTLLTEPIVDKKADGSLAGPLIVQAGSRGLYLGRLDLTVQGHRDPKTKKAEFSIVDYKYQLIPVTADLPEDPRMTALLEKYKQHLKSKPLEETLATVAGNPPGTLDSWIGEIATDAMRQSAQADTALLNNGSFRGDFKEGPLTRQALYGLYPFDDSIVVVDMPGSSLRKILQLSLSQKGQSAFLQVSGLKIRKVGSDLQIWVGAEPLQDRRKYRVAANDFLASGGDGYDFFKFFKSRQKTAVMIRNLVEEALKSRQTLTAADFGKRWDLP